MMRGTVLAGRFRMDRQLGKGAMGEVWRAHDPALGRDVAVKLILHSHADEDGLRRFKREAKAAASLNHPGIMTVHDSGEDEDGNPFIVMELLDGQNLREIVAGHPAGLPVPRVLGLGIQLAEALAVVHGNGIVHRDLHPGNLFIQAGDRLKICDFGISRDNSADSQRGKPNTVHGAPLYAPPEWWLGRPVAVEPAADLYVVGEVLYEMLTGNAPFAGSPSFPELMRRHLDEVPVAPRDLRLNVPKALSELIMRLLAKEPADRPHAADVAACLREIQSRGERETEHRPVGGAPVTAPIACSSFAQGQIEVFALTAPGALRHQWFRYEPGWSPWADMPAPADQRGRVTAVAAGSHDDLHQEVAVAVGRVIHHRWSDHRWSDNGWTGWHDMPSLPAAVTDIALSSLAAGYWEVFALDGNGCLRHRWWHQDLGWSQWHDMPGPDGRGISAIAAGSHSDNHQELFAIVDGEVWHRWWSRGGDGRAGWSGWHMLTELGMRAVDVASSSLTDGHLEVFAVDGSGRLRHRWYWPEPGWSDWVDMPVPPGSLVTAITAGSHSDRHQELFALTADGKVCHQWNWLADDGGPGWRAGSQWSPWHEMPALA